MPSGLWEGPSDQPWVALTIDDGPHPDITRRMLNDLGEAGAPATFFCIGARVQERPDLVQRMHKEGHDVGNHTWSHHPLTYGMWGSPVPPVTRTEELLTELCPGSPRIFRAPFGFIGPGGRTALRCNRLVPIYWSVVPGDWEPIASEMVVDRVMAELHPGAVVVLHGGRHFHKGTADAMPTLVRRIREAGYEVVPITRMLTAAGLPVEPRLPPQGNQFPPRD